MCLALAACGGSSGDEGEGESNEDTGPDPGALLSADFDASSICSGDVERVEWATRRRDCFDPELPCTVPSDPPWITGTSLSCAEVAGSMRFEVEVSQTGKYETQLRGLIGADQQGVHCFGPGGEGRTRVANADLDSNAEFALSEVDASNCSNP